MMKHLFKLPIWFIVSADRSMQGGAEKTQFVRQVGEHQENILQ